MKDNIAVGAMSGAIGGAIGITFSYSMFLLGITPLSSVHLAATLVVIDIINLTTLGFINAVFTHLLVASVFGVLLTYILLMTGKDFWILKGIVFGALFCLMTHAYFIPLMRTDEQVRTLIFNAPSWSIALLTHMLIGLTTATAIVKYHYLFRKPNSTAVSDNNIKMKSYRLVPTPARKKLFKSRKIDLIKPKKK